MSHQPNSGITRKIIERTPIAGTEWIDHELRLILIEYPPGAAAQVHIHPVVGLVYILEGVAESQYEGESLRTFRAGETYQDQAKVKHLIFRNADPDRPLKFLVACHIRAGEPFTINATQT